MSTTIDHRRKWEWNTFLHSVSQHQFNTIKPIKLISKRTVFFLVLLTMRSPLLLKLQQKKKNIIHSWKKKRGWGENISSIPRDTKIVHHQSLKEYWQKEGTDFVLHVLGEYTKKGHECFYTNQNHCYYFRRTTLNPKGKKK